MNNLNNLDNTQNNYQNKPGLPFVVDGIEYIWPEQYITHQQIRHLTGASEDSLESKLFLAVQRPWEDELIDDNNPVNLARPEREHFYFKNILLLVINGTQYVWDRQYISGAEIKKLAGIELQDELYLSIRKPWEDELISNEEEVNLARPGIELFHSKKPTVYTFFIGRKEHHTNNKQLTVREIMVDFAKVDPMTNTLSEKSETGGGFEEFKNLEEFVDLTNIRHFVLFNNESTHVS